VYNPPTPLSGGAAIITQFVYDAIGRKISVTDAEGKTTRFVYDSSSNITQVINAE